MQLLHEMLVKVSPKSEIRIETQKADEDDYNWDEAEPHNVEHLIKVVEPLSYCLSEISAIAM